MWYYGRSTLEIPREVKRFFGLFEELKEIIGPDYSHKQRNTSTAIMKESLGMRLYDDHSPNFDNTHRIQLSAHCPFVIQINYLHAFKETLDPGNEIKLEIRQLGTDNVMLQHAFALEQSAVQVWVRRVSTMVIITRGRLQAAQPFPQSYPLGAGNVFFRVI